MRAEPRGRKIRDRVRCQVRKGFPYMANGRVVWRWFRCASVLDRKTKMVGEVLTVLDPNGQNPQAVAMCQKCSAAFKEDERDRQAIGSLRSPQCQPGT